MVIEETMAWKVIIGVCWIPLSIEVKLKLLCEIRITRWPLSNQKSDWAALYMSWGRLGNVAQLASMWYCLIELAFPIRLFIWKVQCWNVGNTFDTAAWVARGSSRFNNFSWIPEHSVEIVAEGLFQILLNRFNNCLMEAWKQFTQKSTSAKNEVSKIQKRKLLFIVNECQHITALPRMPPGCIPQNVEKPFNSLVLTKISSNEFSNPANIIKSFREQKFVFKIWDM